MSMCSAAVATPDEVSGYTLDEEAVKFQEQIIHGNSAQVLDHRPGEREIQHGQDHHGTAADPVCHPSPEQRADRGTNARG